MAGRLTSWVSIDKRSWLVVTRSRLHTYLLEIQLSLDTPEHIVVDGAAVAHQQHRLALSVDHRAPDLPMLDQLLLSRALQRVLELSDVLGPMEIRRGDDRSGRHARPDDPRRALGARAGPYLPRNPAATPRAAGRSDNRDHASRSAGLSVRRADSAGGARPYSGPRSKLVAWWWLHI